MNEKELRQALADAGCDGDSVEKIVDLRSHGMLQAAVKSLRCCRCDQMDRLHAEQRKIDVYDYVIGNMKKEMESGRS